jgi:hypothetical protein
LQLVVDRAGSKHIGDFRKGAWQRSTRSVPAIARAGDAVRLEIGETQI